MAEPRLKVLISAVHERSEVLAKLSTQLSVQIEQFEQILNELPGKVSAGVKGDDGGSLVFDRKSANEWHLVYRGLDPGRSVSLSNASLEIKMKCVSLFEKLLNQLASVQSDRINQLAQACDTMSSLADRLGLSPKEGQ